VERAAALVAAALDYKAQLDAGPAAAGVQRGRPLSMEQTRYLFSTTAIPGHGQDTVRRRHASGARAVAARHVLVLHRGHACSLDVVGPTACRTRSSSWRPACAPCSRRRRRTRPRHVRRGT
jgi:carnitine O-acetyltransferase